ncbi:hypothetical protein D3C84_1187290 [compost metagenome]
MNDTNARQLGALSKKRCKASGIRAMQRVINRLASQIPVMLGMKACRKNSD